MTEPLSMECLDVCAWPLLMETLVMALEKEIQTYEKLKDQLVAEHEGKYAVISGEELLGVYSTYDDALKIGYEKRELKPFLVKKISSIEPVNYFSRSLEPCRT
jgi:hypothetical protein